MYLKLKINIYFIIFCYNYNYYIKKIDFIKNISSLNMSIRKVINYTERFNIFKK